MRAAVARAGLLLLLLAACAPRFDPPGPPVALPRLDLAPGAASGGFVTADGAVLPLRVWPAEGAPRRVLLAVHGFNDYSNFLDQPARRLATEGTLCYAYDQRGFGAAPERGRWAGGAAMADDLLTLAGLLRRRHPGLPLFVLGESMGAAVAITALAGDPPPAVDGVILSAPAVWGWRAMPFYQRWALEATSRLAPGLRLTGRGLNRVPSDNIEMLRALSRDPLVIKETRVDTIRGLVDLMDAAFLRAADVRVPALVLYGTNDQIIPAGPVLAMLASLPAAPAGRRRVALYEGAYHMLLRDLAADVPLADVASWMAAPAEPLPSAADLRARLRLDPGGTGGD